MVDVGSIYRLTYQVYDGTGALADPNSISVAIYLPGGAPDTPPSFVRDSTGLYHADYQTITVGRHVGTISTTNPTTTKGLSFDINPVGPQFAGIVSLAAGKRHINEDMTQTAHDDEIMEFILVGTDIIENVIGAVVMRTITNERHSAGGSLWLRKYPIVSVTSIQPYLTFGVGYPISLIRWDNDSGRVERLDGYPFIGGPFAVTYAAGRQIVSQTIIGAAKQILAHLWETQRSGMSASGPSEEDVMYAIRGKEYTVPRRVLELLQPGKKPPRVA